ncbi:hypothetical protein JW758_02500 [Candidatus Peregrinibacteria bacterium]|nr:hypothetical protein [Candidatus Peregrinibacteria bacterium]
MEIENVSALPGGAGGLGAGGEGRLVILDTTDSTAPGCTSTPCSPGTFIWNGSTWESLTSGSSSTDPTKVVTVASSGSDYTSISGAANDLNSRGGGIILLSAESHSVTTSVDLSNITLIGKGQTKTTISVSGSGQLDGNGTVFKLLTLSGAAGLTDDMIIDMASDSSSIIFEYCDLAVTDAGDVVIDSNAGTAPTIAIKFVNTNFTAGSGAVLKTVGSANLNTSSEIYVDNRTSDNSLELADWDIVLVSKGGANTTGAITNAPGGVIFVSPDMNLQSAINSIEAGGIGGSIKILPGTHYINTTLTIEDDNIHIHGYGDSSIISASGFTGGETVAAIQVGAADGSASVNGVTLHHFKLEVTGTGASDIHGIRVTGGEDNKIDDVTIQKVSGASGTGTGTRAGVQMTDGLPGGESVGGGGGGGDGGPEGWEKYFEFTLESSYIPEDQSNFPVYLDLSQLGDSHQFWTDYDATTDNDLVITNADGSVRYPVEVVYIDETPTPNEGEIYFRVTDLDGDADSTFRIYYDNPSVSAQPSSTNTYGRNAVWSNSYLAVYHFQDNIASTTVTDSTGSYNGTANINTSTFTKSDIFYGQGYDFSSDYINLGSDFTNSINTLTLSAWVESDDNTTKHNIISSKSSDEWNAPGFNFMQRWWDIAIAGNSMANYNMTSTPVDRPLYFAGTINKTGGTNNIALYEDDNDRGDYSSAFTSSTGNIYIGSAANGTTDMYDGVIDEVRIASVVRSANWLLTVYNNMNAPDTFTTYDSTVYSATTTVSGEWTKYFEITTDADLIPSDQTNFPVYFDMRELGDTHEFWDDYDATTDNDLIVTNGNATERYPVEVVDIDETTTPNSGEIYFKVPVLDGDADTTFRVYYANDSVSSQPSVSDTYGRNNVWTNSYAAVYHMEESPDNSADQIIDSTGNGNDAQTANMESGDGANGQLGGGINFGGTDEYASAPNAATLEVTGNATISAWYNRTASTSNEAIAALSVDGEDENLNCLYQLNVMDDDTLVMEWEYSTGTNVEVNSSSVVPDPTGSWEYYVSTRDNTSNEVTFYSNGSQLGTVQSFSNDPTGGTDTPLYIGAERGLDYFAIGVIDELRISSVERTANWVATEYANQSSPSTFFTDISNVVSSTGHPLIRPTISDSRILGDSTAGAYFTDGIHITSDGDYGSGVTGNGGVIQNAVLQRNEINAVGINGMILTGLNESEVKNNIVAIFGVDTAGNGLLIGSAENLNVSANTIESPQNALSIGIAVENINTGGAKTTSSIFNNNILEGATYNGAGFTQGISIGNSNNTEVSKSNFIGNKIKGAASGTSIGINVTGNADDNLFADNFIDGGDANLWDTGIFLSSNLQDRNIIRDNRFDNTTVNINETGTGTKIDTSHHRDTTDPTGTEDIGDEYEVGTIWVNTSSDTAYMLTDSTTGIANWTLLTGEISFEEEVGPTGYTKYFEFNTESSQIPGDITGYPIYLDLSQLGDGHQFWTDYDATTDNDLIITNADGSVQYPVEVVFIDESTTPNTGEIYFKPPTLDGDADTTYRLYYDNPSISAQPAVTATYGRNNVWTNYIAVYHLNETLVTNAVNAQGTTAINGVPESNMTAADSLTAANCKVGHCIDFDSDGNSTIVAPDNTALEPTSISVSAWIYRNGGQDTWAKPLWYGANDPSPWGVYGFEFIDTSDTNLGWKIQNSASTAPTISGSNIPDTSWSHIYGTYTSGDMKYYVNGSSVGTDTITGSLTGYAGTNGLALGGKDAGTTGDQEFLGRIDEVRIANNANTRDTNYLLTEYNNTNTPGSFITFSSSVVSVSTGGTGVGSNTYTLDVDNTGGNVTLQFGATLGESLAWDSANTEFDLSDNLDINSAGEALVIGTGISGDLYITFDDGTDRQFGWDDVFSATHSTGAFSTFDQELAFRTIQSSSTPVACTAGIGGMQWMDTDTGIIYVCDTSNGRDKWLSINEFMLFGEETGTCAAGSDASSSDTCNVDWGNGLGPDTNTDLGMFVPQPITITGYGFSQDDDSCTSGSFDLEIWSTGSASDDDGYTLEQTLASGLTDEIYNANGLNVNLAGNQYTLWGIDNNCGQGMDDWNMVVYYRYRHD